MAATQEDIQEIKEKMEAMEMLIEQNLGTVLSGQAYGTGRVKLLEEQMTAIKNKVNNMLGEFDKIEDNHQQTQEKIGKAIQDAEGAHAKADGAGQQASHEGKRLDAFQLRMDAIEKDVSVDLKEHIQHIEKDIEDIKEGTHAADTGQAPGIGGAQDYGLTDQGGDADGDEVRKTRGGR